MSRKSKIVKLTLSALAVLVLTSITLVRHVYRANSPTPDATKAPLPRCATTPALNGKCYVIHAQMDSRNGRPPYMVLTLDGNTYYIALDDSYPIPDAADVFYTRLQYWGDFTVCPLGLDPYSRLWMVCIDSVASLESSQDTK